MAVAPFEILYGPLELYRANENTAAPDLNASTLTGWTSIGKSGAKNITEDGVTIAPSQTVEEVFVVGSTAPQKASRSQESLSVTINIMDMQAEALSVAFNLNAVTDTAPGSGTAGVRSINLLRGVEITTFALLARGKQSPYGDDWGAQFWVPKVYVSEVGELSYVKGTPVGLAMTFMALEHSTNGFGKYYAQDAAAT